MPGTSRITDDSALDKRCRASVEASMRFFTLSLGLVSVSSPADETSLFSIITQILSQTATIFGLPDPDSLLAQPSTAEAMLSSIFTASPDVLPFVLDRTSSGLSALDAQSRASILAQSVAGVVTLIHKLALLHAPVLTPGVLAREFSLFSRSAERADVLSRVESQASSLFHSCLMKRDVADLILAAVCRGDVHFESPVHTPSVEDYKTDVFGGWERQRSDMGLPGGFTIMVLN